jgi:hypothetical protein
MRLRLSAKNKIKKGKKKGLPAPPRPVPRSVGSYQAVDGFLSGRDMCGMALGKACLCSY